MLYNFGASLITIFHLGFIVFVIAGGFAAWKWRTLVYVHVPAVLWGALIEFTGWICPLTPLENYLRTKAGTSTYSGSFTEHYIVPLIYPRALTRQDQIFIGLGILALNLAAYGLPYMSPFRRRRL